MFKQSVIIFLLLIILFLFSRYYNKQQRIHTPQIESHHMTDPIKIREYLQQRFRKPVIWIHIDYDYNAMNWSSFFSRGNFDMNIPYINLTVESIINKCSKSFNICIVNDKTFKYLLPNWNTDLSRVGDPLKCKIRYYGLISLLCEYGGMLVPSSFLCLQDLKPIYNICKQTDKPITFEGRNNNYNNDIPVTTSFIGCNIGDNMMTDYKNYLERNLSRDYTDESMFLNDNSKWIKLRVIDNKIKCLNGQLIGIRDNKNNEMRVQNIVQTTPIELIDKENLYGILIPNKELLKRKEYKWFCYLSKEELATSNMDIKKYFFH